jgi:hypothetical protein
MTEAQVQELTVTLRVVKIASSFIGICTVGGLEVRGNRCDSAQAAAQNLLANLGAPNNDNAAMGIELELAGMTLADLAPRKERIAELESELGIGGGDLE